MATIEWPLESFNITEGFGGGRAHTGVDLAAPFWTPIYATDHGTVEASGDGASNPWMGWMAGLYVLIRHDWGFSGYAHMINYVVHAGQWVARGQLIGYVGSTGASTGPHCHFETLPLNPNWSNGYAGRIDPISNHTLVPHSSTPPEPEPEPIDKDKPVAYIYGVNSSGTQSVAGGTKRWVETGPGASAIASGAGQYMLETTYDLTGTAGTRVALTSYRITVAANGAETETMLEEIDVTLQPNGRARRQLVIANNLNSNERLRVRITVPAGSNAVKVDRYSFRGYKWDL